MGWLKNLLYGKKVTYNSVYYQSGPPDPKKGWLKKSALVGGDLWFDVSVSNTPYVWTDGIWKKLGTD